jgi:hypothetical protein
MRQNQKGAWDIILKLMQGFQSHHKKSTSKNFINKKGNKAMNDSKNLQILSDHYQTVYNIHTEIDPTVLNKAPQHPIQQDLGKTPSKKGIQSAIRHMKNDKAPGYSNVTTDMLKNLPQQKLDLLSELITKYWPQPTADFHSWYITKLSSVYKGKCNQQDPNNHEASA